MDVAWVPPICEHAEYLRRFLRAGGDMSSSSSAEKGVSGRDGTLHLRSQMECAAVAVDLRRAATGPLRDRIQRLHQCPPGKQRAQWALEHSSDDDEGDPLVHAAGDSARDGRWS